MVCERATGDGCDRRGRDLERKVVTRESASFTMSSILRGREIAARRLRVAGHRRATRLLVLHVRAHSAPEALYTLGPRCFQLDCPE